MVAVYKVHHSGLKPADLELALKTFQVHLIFVHFHLTAFEVVALSAWNSLHDSLLGP